jgi:hypothetical protein
LQSSKATKLQNLITFLFSFATMQLTNLIK